MQKVRVTPLIGLPQFDGWSQVITQSSNQGVWALAVSGQHAGNVGRDIVDSTIDKEFSSSQEVYEYVVSLIAQTKEKGCELSCACLVTTPDKNIFCAYQGSVTLKRHEKLGKLLTTGKEVKIVEGQPHPEDLYILATTQAVQFLGEIEQKVRQGFDADTIVTSITPGMRLEDNTACSALAFTTRYEQTQPEPDPEPEPEPVDDDDSAFSIEILQKKEVDEEDKPPESTPEPEIEQEQPSQPEISLTEETKDLQNLDITDLSEFPGEEADSELELVNKFEPDSQPQTQPKVKRIKFDSTQLKSLLARLWPILVKLGTKTLLVARSGFKFAREKGPGLMSLSWFRKQSWFRNPFSKDVYLNPPPTKKILKIVLPVVFVLVAVGGSYAYFRYTRNQQLTRAQEQVTPVIAQIDEARAQLEANPILAREMAQNVVNSMLEIEETFTNQPGASGYIEKQLSIAQQFLDDISGREEFNDLPVFFDARDVESDYVITNFGRLNNKAVLYDRGKQTLVLLDLETKEFKTASTSEIPEVVDLGFREVNDTVWFLAEGVRQFQPEIQTTISQEISQDSSNENARFLAPFADSIYILNQENRAIYRYPGEDDGFGDPVSWLRSTQGLNMEEVVSFVIDGDIWLTTNQGEVIRLRSGNQQDFSVTGLANPFSESIYIYTTDEAESLYILDPGNHRLVILNKEGEFLREIQSTTLASATDFVVNQDETKNFVVSGSLIYEIEL